MGAAKTKQQKSQYVVVDVKSEGKQPKPDQDAIKTVAVTASSDKKSLTVVKDEKTEIEVSKKFDDYENEEVKKRTIPSALLITMFVLVLVLLSFSIFTIHNTTSNTIANGIFIKGVDVSGLSKDSAKRSIETFISEHSSDELVLKHGDCETTISLEQISANFDIDSAIDEAYNASRQGNPISNSITALRLLFSHIDIDPKFTCDENQLAKSLEDISPNLPDRVVESSYYIEGNTLIATKGKAGAVVNVDEMKNFVKNQIYNLNFRDKSLNIITTQKNPETLNLKAIYEEIHKEPKDAKFIPDPISFTPSEDGIDFAISLEEAQKMLDSSPGEECEIPLKILKPNVTNSMIGNEAFPNQLSTFSTRYSANANRTTNLAIAAGKINGTVLMPGETFSYNKVVGERTIAAGYKDAAMYVDGQTVDGLAGRYLPSFNYFV